MNAATLNQRHIELWNRRARLRNQRNELDERIAAIDALLELRYGGKHNAPEMPSPQEAA